MPKPIETVIKRDGSRVPFNIYKIKNAVKKAGEACKKDLSDETLDNISMTALLTIASDKTELSVEEIQDGVEKAISLHNLPDVAKAYILYRENRRRARDATKTMLNYQELVDNYLKVNDWRVKENSTVGYSLGGLILSNSGAITANYWLSEVYDKEIADAHRNADMHIHDLGMLSGYCFTGDTRVKTIDGENYSFKEMTDMGISQIGVYSYDSIKNTVVPAIAVNPRKTRTVKKIASVELDDGNKIECTLDHQFLLSNLEYKEAQELTQGDEIETIKNEAGNRKVIRVEIKDKETDVYDLTVPKYENFALANGIIVHNCAGWSLKQLIKEGIGGVPGKITSAPAAHLSTLCNQMVNFLGIMQNEWAGAQAFSSFDTYLAPFVKVDNLSYKEVKQCIQSFVFGMNTPSRWGTQAPFTNITLDWVVPPDLADEYCIVGGKEMPFKYKDCKKEMDMVNKAFIEIMIEGDANGRGYQYPIPTYSITKNFDWSETENNKLLFEMTAKYGTPYFSNYINSDMEPSDVRSMCPIAASENVLVFDDYLHEFHVSNIKSLYRSNERGAKRKLYILHKGKIKEALLHRYENRKLYEIELNNGHKICLSEDHTNLTLDGLKRTDELTDNDYLPFNLTPYQGTGLSYDEGYLVGAFLGDGSYRDDRSIILSLNDKSKAHVIEKIKLFCKKMGAKYDMHMVSSGIGKGCINMTITSKYIRGLVEEFVVGNSALNKYVHSRVIGKSIEFRNGIVDGMYDTDGGNHNRIYSSSKEMIDSLALLFASLGQATRIDIDERGKDKTLSDNPIWCIRFYDKDGLSFRTNVFKKKDGYMWFKINKISEKPGNLAFCFEVLNDEEPYFMLPSGLVTHNCRLRLDLRELRKKSGGYFGSGESTGSIGVVTLNMPRIAYLSADEKDFYRRLSDLMDVAARSLKVKREVITDLLDKGLYPYTKRYLGSFNNHFSTIGLVGMNEAGLNAKWIRKDLTHDEAQKFAVDVLNFMRERLSDYQERYGDLYNLEATPAESTSYRLAKHDKERYPDIITANECSGVPYYTNSSHLPVGYTEDIFDALDVQDKLQTLYTSGTVFHAFLGEKLPDWKAAAKLVKTIAENYKLPYYTISPTYSVCKEHGYINGEHFTCPKCGEVSEVYSRITGYYRPVQNWNAGKTQEFKDRKEYDAEHSKIHKKTEPETVRAENTDIEAETDLNDGIYLVTTETCPNCKTVKEHLARKKKEFKELKAEENRDLLRAMRIVQAPTLLIVDNGSYKKITGLSKIEEMV